MSTTKTEKHWVAANGNGFPGIGPGPLTDSQLAEAITRHLAGYDTAHEKNADAEARLRALYVDVRVPADEPAPEEE